ncbi:MAG: hypothetical protein HFJ38_06845 [Bacilli bacterium]|nr:hypothetical protein [Bacilli bacterium]
MSWIVHGNKWNNGIYAGFFAYTCSLAEEVINDGSRLGILGLQYKKC